MLGKVARLLTLRLPEKRQQDLRRLKLVRQFEKGNLISDEPEFAELSHWLAPGDSVIDIGANVGAYTMAMSKIVGPMGRVFAFEPIPKTFEILAAIAGRAPNVTLFNAAVSDKTDTVQFQIPTWDDGAPNYYECSMNSEGEHRVFAIALDSIDLPRISLIKIDAEGAESMVLRGMQGLLQRDHPRLIVEGGESVAEFLSTLGYVRRATDGTPSPNTVFEPDAELIAARSPLVRTATNAF